jgi:hypothetical protein
MAPDLSGVHSRHREKALEYIMKNNADRKVSRLRINKEASQENKNNKGSSEGSKSPIRK